MARNSGWKKKTKNNAENNKVLKKKKKKLASANSGFTREARINPSSTQKET